MLDNQLTQQLTCQLGWLWDHFNVLATFEPSGPSTLMSFHFTKTPKPQWGLSSIFSSFDSILLSFFVQDKYKTWRLRFNYLNSTANNKFILYSRSRLPKLIISIWTFAKPEKHHQNNNKTISLMTVVSLRSITPTN